jgi:glycosyltransferase involved in cell wall biosynthesis
MKIAYLSTFHPYRGGIAQFNASLYRALGGAGHEVRAFNFTRQYPDILFPGKTQLVQPGDVADAVPNERVLDSVNPFTWPAAASAINRVSPDLLVMKFWMSFFGPSFGAVAGRMKPPTKVVTVLDNVIAHEKRFFDVPFTKYFLRRNHGFVAMSATVERDLLSLVPGARCIRIPHPLYDHFGAKLDPAAARARLGVPEGKRVVLFFGFIRDYKGLDLLIEAFGRLDDRYVLVIAGETYGSFSAYDSLIARSPLKANIRVFNDYIPDARVPEFFSASDVCVLPYKSATQSGITSIAYHFDLPVVATDVGALADDVGGRKTGLVAGAPDPEAIAAGIRRYFEEGMKAECVRNIARVKEEESWPRFAERLTRFAASL